MGSSPHWEISFLNSSSGPWDGPLLVHPKDQTETLDKCGVVYKLSCLDCPSSYISESARTLRSCVKEHSKPGASPVFEHTSYTNHNVDKEGVKVLDKEDNWFQKRSKGGHTDLVQRKQS